MVKGKKIAFCTSLLATLAVSTSISHYRDYLYDPDLFDKVVFDLTGKIEESDEDFKVKNNLYELLLCKDEDEEFNRELDRTYIIFLEEYKKRFDPRDHKRKKVFSDNNLLTSFLKGNNDFLKSSIDRGYFFYAAGSACLDGIDFRKIKKLLECSFYQFHSNDYKSPNVYIISQDKNIDIKKLLDIYAEDLEDKIRESLEGLDSKSALKKYGMTIRFIKNKLENRLNQIRKY